MTLSPAHLQAVCVHAARRAAEHVLANLHRRHETIAQSRNDIKHVLDVEAQQAAESAIRAIFPRHAMLGEEDSRRQPAGPDAYEWVIDPIDGTVNFFHGLPMWCASVAVRRGGKTLAGCVYAPEMHRLYEASLETPALCNGHPVSVSQTAAADRALIGTGADKWDLGAHAFRYMRAIAEIAQRPRILGAAALDICLVAEGATDAFFESGLYIWDIAAGALILQRAGGLGETLKTRPDGRLAFLGSNSHLHSAIKAKIQPMLAAEA